MSVWKRGLKWTLPGVLGVTQMMVLGALTCSGMGKRRHTAAQMGHGPVLWGGG